MKQITWLILAFLLIPMVYAEGPLEITEVIISDITETSAIVTWQTNLESDSAIAYGETTDFGLTTEDSELTVEHSFSLTDLTAGSDYYLEVTSCIEGECVTSGPYAFVTAQTIEEVSEDNFTEELEEIIEEVTEEPEVTAKAVESPKVAEETKKIKRSGSAVVTRNGVYFTYVEGQHRKLLAVGSANPRVQSWSVELMQSGAEEIVFRVNNENITLSLGESKQADLDGDTIADIELMYYEMPFANAAKLFFKSIHVAITSDTISYSPEEVFDIDPVVVENVVEDYVSSEESSKSSIWTYLLVLVILIALVVVIKRKKK